VKTEYGRQKQGGKGSVSKHGRQQRGEREFARLRASVCAYAATTASVHAFSPL